MERVSRQIKRVGCSELHKMKIGLNDYDILRNAYELILENSQIFYEELADAFIAQTKIVRSTES
jgi:hypothetical protein